MAIATIMLVAPVNAKVVPVVTASYSGGQVSYSWYLDQNQLTANEKNMTLKGYGVKLEHWADGDWSDADVSTSSSDFDSRGNLIVNRPDVKTVAYADADSVKLGVFVASPEGVEWKDGYAPYGNFAMPLSSDELARTKALQVVVSLYFNKPQDESNPTQDGVVLKAFAPVLNTWTSGGDYTTVSLKQVTDGGKYSLDLLMNVSSTATLPSESRGHRDVFLIAMPYETQRLLQGYNAEETLAQRPATTSLTLGQLTRNDYVTEMAYGDGSASITWENVLPFTCMEMASDATSVPTEYRRTVVPTFDVITARIYTDDNSMTMFDHKLVSMDASDWNYPLPSYTVTPVMIGTDPTNTGGDVLRKNQSFAMIGYTVEAQSVEDKYTAKAQEFLNAYAGAVGDDQALLRNFYYFDLLDQSTQGFKALYSADNVPYNELWKHGSISTTLDNSNTPYSWGNEYVRFGLQGGTYTTYANNPWNRVRRIRSVEGTDYPYFVTGQYTIVQAYPTVVFPIMRFNRWAENRTPIATDACYTVHVGSITTQEFKLDLGEFLENPDIRVGKDGHPEERMILQTQRLTNGKLYDDYTLYINIYVDNHDKQVLRERGLYLFQYAIVPKGVRQKLQGYIVKHLTSVNPEMTTQVYSNASGNELKVYSLPYNDGELMNVELMMKYGVGTHMEPWAYQSHGYSAADRIKDMISSYAFSYQFMVPDRSYRPSSHTSAQSAPRKILDYNTLESNLKVTFGGLGKVEDFIDIEIPIAQIPTAIDEVTVSNVDAPVEYYNLQGMRVTQLQQGELYIMLQAGKATKVRVN